MKSIEELRQIKGTFEIGKAISDGWGFVSKHLGYYIGAGLIAVMISSFIGFIPFAGSIIDNLIVSPCFAASAIFITWRISKGYGWTDFGDMFKGFSYATPVVISTLIKSLVLGLIGLLCFFSLIPQLVDLWQLAQGSGAYQNQEEISALVQDIFLDPKNILLFCLFILAVLVLSALWAFRIHFIVVYNMDAWPAMELSRKVTAPNILRLVVLYMIIGLIVLLSALPCGIGLLFSLPLSIGAIYSAFAQITGSDQPDGDSNYMFDFMAGESNDSSQGV